MNDIAKIDTNIDFLKSMKDRIRQNSGLSDADWHEHEKATTMGLYRLRVAYPTQARNYDAVEVDSLTALWLEIFADVKPRVLAEAVTLYIKNDRSGFFPSPGQVMGAVEEILESKPKKRFIQTGTDDAGNYTGYWEDI